MPRRFPLLRITRPPAIYLPSAGGLLVGIVPITGSPPVAAAPIVTVVSEVGGEAEEQLTVTFGRPRDVAADELVVPIQLAEPSIANRNAATIGTDVSTVQSSLVFPAGSTIGTVDLAVVDDGLLEGPEDVDILLGLPGGVERTTVTIADSSRLNLTIRPGTGLLDEGESTTARVSSTAAPVNPIYLTVRTEDASGVGGVDYEPLDVAVTIPAGLTESEPVTVRSIDDETGDVYEASFSLRVFAGAPTDVADGDRPIASWFLRVLDDDEYLRFVRDAGQDDAPVHQVLVDEPVSGSVDIELPIELLFDRPPYGGISGEIFLEPITTGPNTLDPSAPAAELGTDLTVSRSPFPFDVAPPPPLVVTINADDVVEPVAAELATHRLVTVVGTSRVGKTLLAQHVERTVASAFDRVIAVDLDDLASVDPDSILRALAGALDVNEQSLGSVDDNLVDSIGARSVLVRLDTAELATDGVLQVVRRLRRVSGLRLLVTSQVPLRAAGERLVRLHGLSADDAVALLAQTAPVSDERDDTLLKELAVRLDGVPLALELAAARLDALGAAETLRQLDRGAALAGGDDRPERHRSTLAAARWSIGLLDHDERVLLARLATHTAPFTPAAAGHTWGIPPLTADRVEQLVTRLIDRSLVQRVDGGAQYRLLDTIRTAVLDADADADDSVASNEGRLNEVVFETAVAALVGAPTAVQLDDLADELVATLDRLHRADDERELLLAGSLALYWIARSRAAKGGELLDRALATHRAAPDEIYGPVAGIASMVSYVRGDMHRTRDLLSLMGERGGGFVSPNVQYSIDASLAFLERRYGDAAELYGKALHDFSEPSSTRLLYLWLGANTLWYAGQPEEAGAQYRQLRREAEEMNDRYNAALGLRFEAMVTAELGDVERAWRLAERGVSSAVDLGDAGGRSQAEVAVAIVAAASEAMVTARRHALDAIEATLGPYDLFTQRAAPVIVAASFLDAGDAATAATAIGWYLDYLDRTGQPPAVGVAALARRTEDGARAALGGADFAHIAAGGARLRLRELQDLLLARDRLEQSSGADGLATT
ncbi:MAG: Calx-beta domain-containing protein [Actinomycetota bacterium]